ncbi:MAG TPA: glycoside hydrolase family 32 protein, partial [Fimbriimonas sp.]|nr:glycoside hydrolase family 32 protein [Fimbriimonas sp.]
FTARQWTEHRLNPGQRQEGWINDLNGLIHYKGQWHLFAQRWAKCWLHAVSTDLVHWTELEPAFWEESDGSGVQSGTCVVDFDNTSGLSHDKAHPPMVAFWSRFDNQSQCISYSLDDGKTWTRYEHNPTFIHPERDPKVFWYEPGKHWVMVMYGGEQYHVLTSTDLLHWNDEHNPIPHSFECPDIFELPLDGDATKMKWVLIQGNGNYSIGSFDGHKYTEEGERHRIDLGPNFYATQSWENARQKDRRRIQAAWMQGSDFPDMPFNQQISFPCELTLHSTPAGPRIFRKPVHELSSIQGEPKVWKDVSLERGQIFPLVESGDLYRLVADVSIPEGASLEINLRGDKVVLDSKRLQSGPARGEVQGSIHRIEILLDRASIEAFANDGELSSTRFFLPHFEGVSLHAVGGPVKVEKLTLWPLRSIWNPA